MEFPIARILITAPLMFINTEVFASVQQPSLSLEKQIDSFFADFIVQPLASLMFWEIPFVGFPLIVAWLLFGAFILPSE